MDEAVRRDAIENLDRAIELADRANKAIENGANLDGPEMQEFRQAIREVNSVLGVIEAEIIQSALSEESYMRERRRAPHPVGQHSVLGRFFRSALFPLLLITIIVYVASQILGATQFSP